MCERERERERGWGGRETEGDGVEGRMTMNSRACVRVRGKEGRLRKDRKRE